MAGTMVNRRVNLRDRRINCAEHRKGPTISLPQGSERRNLLDGEGRRKGPRRTLDGFVHPDSRGLPDEGGPIERLFSWLL